MTGRVGWLALGLAPIALVAGVLTGRAEPPAGEAGAGVATRWAAAQACAGAQAARDRSSCEHRCQTARAEAAAAAGPRNDQVRVNAVSKRGRRAARASAASSCRCSCTAAVLTRLEKSCGELGLVSGLGEIGPGARACFAPRLSPEAACVLRCDDVLDTCVDSCDRGTRLTSEPNATSCISGCFSFARSCLGLCEDKGQRPASLANSR